jgi:hypothetical protein
MLAIEPLCPGAGGRGGRSRIATMMARNTNEPIVRRTALNAWGSSSTKARLTTEKFAPQMIVIRSRSASMRRN